MLLGKFALKITGLLVGTIASYHTAACLMRDIPQLERTADFSTMGDNVTLFDFTTTGIDLSNWIESSDTVREPGMSKATFVLQKSQLFQRAVFFALLNPQPNGAGFAGVRHPVDFDLSNFSSIELKLRGQGQKTNFKIVLKHHGEVGDGSPSYEQFFTAPNEMKTVSLAIDQFKPYWRGKPLKDAEPLDTSNVTSFGIQYYGGVYEESKQSGPATLEIDWIKVSL